jgi:hypothetical protein
MHFILAVIKAMPSSLAQLDLHAEAAIREPVGYHKPHAGKVRSGGTITF